MRRRALRRGPVAAVGLLGLVAVLGAVVRERGGLKDLAVYRYGGAAVLDGRSVYASAEPVTGLPFTYPPFAAVLMAPLAAVPGWLAAGLWTAASVAALAAAIVVVRRALGRSTPRWTLTILVCAALAFEPVWQTLTFGQVNLLLMLAVLADLLRTDGRWSGVLIGIAAGVKLTPLVFVVLLVLAGRRAAAGRAVLAFLATIAVGFVAAPASSAAYWDESLLAARRVGPPAFVGNQSVHGAVSRLLDAPSPTPVWLAVAGPLALLVLVLGARWWRRGDPVLGTCLAAMAMLLASPISWSHHWVWAVPVALLLWERSRWAAAGWSAAFVAAPIWWPPNRELREYDWSPLDHVVGNAYLVAALALSLWAALALRRAGSSIHAEGAESARVDMSRLGPGRLLRMRRLGRSPQA